MPEKESLPINIWGKPGCDLPSGNLCDACCNVKRIVDKNWGRRVFYKKPNVSCVFMARTSNKGQGCAIHVFAPNSCENYHCSKEIPRIKLDLINYALSENLVTEEQAQKAVSKIINMDNPNR